MAEEASRAVSARDPYSSEVQKRYPVQGEVIDETSWTKVEPTRNPNTIGIHYGNHNITISVPTNVATAVSASANSEKQLVNDHAVESKKKNKSKAERSRSLGDELDPEVTKDAKTDSSVKASSSTEKKKRYRKKSVVETPTTATIFDDFDDDLETVTSIDDRPEVEEEISTKKKSRRSTTKTSITAPVEKPYNRVIVEKQLNKYGGQLDDELVVKPSKVKGRAQMYEESLA